jgi:hypothetical protein
MFKQAIIHYPKDDKAWRQICKEIAALHCTAAVKYMDTLNLNLDQKATLIDSLMHDLTTCKQASA